MWTYQTIARHLLGDGEYGLHHDAIHAEIPISLRGRVPQALLSLWEQIGSSSMMTCFQQIAAPDKVRLHGDQLIFMEENQGVCVWACCLPPGEQAISTSCDEDDPHVFQYAVTDAGLGGPHPEGVILSEFLTAMLIMQAVQSQLLTHTGYDEVPTGEGVAMFRATMHALPSVGAFHPFIGDHAAVGIIVDGDHEVVLAATNHAESFARIAQQLGIDDPDDFTI
jgi:hypothetical protein